MSFGKKGLAPGQAVSAPGGGFGRAAPAAAAASAMTAEQEEIAAKREAFLAQERARQAQAQESARAAEAADPMASLRNDARPKHNFQARAASPLGMGVAGAGAGAGAGAMGAGGMSAAQEAEIRQAARSMAGRGPAPRPGGSSSGGSGFFFGEPSHRNLGMAYVLWFFLSQFSAHRFYCGQKDTAIMQMAMWFVSLVMLFIFPLFGILGLGLWFCWIIGDLFMIPGMLKKFQEEHNYAGVFT